MTLKDLHKYTTKKEAQRLVNILRENLPSEKVKRGNSHVNGYDIVEAKNKFRELLLKANEADRDDLFAIYEPHYDLLSLMIERGEV